MRRKLVIAAVTLLVGGLVAGAAAAWGLWKADQLLDAPLALPAKGINHVVSPGESLRDVTAAFEQTERLEAPAPLLLNLYARWQGDAHRIKAGEFHIPASTTPRQLLDILVRGRVVQHSITLVEGWTFRQAIDAIRAHEVIVPTDEFARPLANLKAIGKPELHPEGALLPDTYNFTRGTTDRDIVRRAHRALEDYLAKAWEKREDKLPLESPYEALTLASIVEKETGLASERPEIAGVFVRRLRRKMRLETDPTVIYGLGDTFDGNITRKHLRQATAYNTYVIPRLPPTPIALAGREAIDAVLHPKPGKSLFFVSRGDGSHYFSATYAEHDRAVDKYQRKRRRKKSGS